MSSGVRYHDQSKSRFSGVLKNTPTPGVRYYHDQSKYQYFLKKYSHPGVFCVGFFFEIHPGGVFVFCVGYFF